MSVSVSGVTRRTRYQLRHAIAAFAVSTVAVALSKLVLSPSPFGDLRIYRLEGDAVRHGADLYGQLPGVDGLATYPPFAGIAFTIMTLLPFAVLKVVNLLLTAGALAWVCVATGRLCGVERRRAATVGLTVAAAGLWCEPVLMTLHYGQIDLYLVALVLWDFTRPAGSRVSGVGIGLAAAIKVTPGVFIVYLLLTRRWATAARSIAVFAATLVASLIVDAHATLGFWTDHLFDTERVGRLEDAVNQTVRGWLVRAEHTRDTGLIVTVLVVGVAVIGLWTATRAFRTRGDKWGVPAAAVTGLLCSPISWSHHWVWALPILVVLWFERQRWLVLIGVAVFWSFAVWAVPHGDRGDPVELGLARWQVLVSGWYVGFGLVFLAVTLRRTSLGRTSLRCTTLRRTSLPARTR